MIEDKIEDARVHYKIAMNFCSWLYFVTQDLATVDHMYQFSMEWFSGIFNSIKIIELYVKTIESLKLREENKMKARCDKIIAGMKLAFYQNISQSLYSQHKLLFGFLMTIRILQAEGGFDPKIYDIFVHDNEFSQSIHESKENPLKELISAKSWNIIQYISELLKPVDENEIKISEHFIKNKEKWSEFIKDDKNLYMELPEFLNTNKLDLLVQLVFCKILRKDKLLYKIIEIVNQTLGEDIAKISNNNTTLKELIVQSNPRKPIMLLLTPGFDPVNRLQTFAKEFNDTRLEVISLGQGQGTLAKKRILEFRKNGGWVLLQNCHLYSSWMPELEDLIEETALISSQDRNVLSPEYRLWLTTVSDPSIPIQIIHRSIKCTNEQPKGVKANMLKIYTQIRDNKEKLAEWNSHSKNADWKKLFMGLAFFHSILMERTRYGTTGWQGMCNFTDSDFNQASKFLYKTLEDYKIYPYEKLRKYTIECYYAQNIIDEKDKEFLKNLLEDFYNDNVIYSNIKFFNKDQNYTIPNLVKIEDVIQFISEKVSFFKLKK